MVLRAVWLRGESRVQIPSAWGSVSLPLPRHKRRYKVITDSKHGLPSDLLEIELIESLFMSDVTLAVELLHAMKKLGVSLSIDDFGTGYSSLSYLSRFPIDVLKIDRSFVADITRDASDAAIVASIIALAHNLKLDVQDFYFSRPLAAADFEQLIREHLAAKLSVEAF